MPNPPPVFRQLSLCADVALSSLGNHASGAEIVLPSARSTIKLSSEKRTAFTASPGLGSEEVIPRLQAFTVMDSHDSLDSLKLTGTESDL